MFVIHEEISREIFDNIYGKNFMKHFRFDEIFSIGYTSSPREFSYDFSLDCEFITSLLSYRQMNLANHDAPF